MGDIVPFIARVRETGDWSPGERARLEEFGERLAASGARIEVIFGTTDEGDPWCVVKDHNEDVLVHVARIDGRFVVYSAIEDVVAEDTNLYEALRVRLADAVEIPTAQVLPFALSREAQTFVALIVATAFFYETGGLDTAFHPPAAPTDVEAQPDADEPAATADRDEVHERNVITQGALFAEAVTPAMVGRQLLAMAIAPASEMPLPMSAKDLPQVTPLETTTRLPAAVMLAKSEVAQNVERMVADQSAERIVGTAGADTLRGAALDTLEGGAGDDRLVLAGATAIGGSGADIFVIAPPAILGRPDTLLGVIEDFDAGEGDRVENTDGVGVSLLPPTLGAAGNDKGKPPAPYTRVEVDVDGDGTIDGYILVRPRTTPSEGGDTTHGRPGALDGHASDVDAGVGRAFFGGDAWA